ncbi:MAG: hypothetical protein SXU28_11575 [Pseudomonadota bacterium]|nr:hypothetical protein [Pseudomonadota bacterium]
MVENSENGGEGMSEEDLIKQQLVKLFTEALTSEVAKDGRTQFVHSVADEFTNQLAETMAQHQAAMRADMQSLRNELAGELQKERDALRNEAEAYRNAAADFRAPIPSGNRDYAPLEDDHEMTAFEEQTPNLAPKAGRMGRSAPVAEEHAEDEVAAEAVETASSSDAMSPLIKWGLVVLGVVVAALVGFLAVLGIGSLTSDADAQSEQLLAICDEISPEALADAEGDGSVPGNIQANLAAETATSQGDAASDGAEAGDPVQSAREAQLERLYQTVCSVPATAENGTVPTPGLTSSLQTVPEASSDPQTSLQVQGNQ